MKTLRFLRLAGAATLVLSVLSVPMFAFQEEAAADAHGKKKKSWLELFETTGPVGYLMLGCSIAGTTLVIEHLVSLRREKLAPAVLAGDLEALINEEEFDQAVELCDENPCYLGNVVGSALRMRDAGYQEMIAGLEAAANEETFKLNTKISYLSLIGNVAPLLGLLGTVTGMISSFQVIETLKAPTPGDLAKGVYESLVNTTMGLFIAILFLTVYFLFKNKVSKMCLSINLQAVDMLRHLAASEKAAA
jgi:biopolymer transport protein ExbB